MSAASFRTDSDQDRSTSSTRPHSPQSETSALVISTTTDEASPSSRIVGFNRLFDANEEKRLARFYELCGDVITSLDSARNYLEQNKWILADSEAAVARRHICELATIRGISDSVSYIVDRALSVFSGNPTVLDISDHLAPLEYAIGRLRNEPFMAFEDAIELADRIPSVGTIQSALDGITDLIAAIGGDDVEGDGGNDDSD